jgi:neutral trehalase
MNTFEALAYVSAIFRLRRHGYSSKKILKQPKLVVFDLGFNSIFIRANDHLKHIAKEIGKELPASLQENIKLSEENIDQLWDGYTGQFQSKSFRTQQLTSESTIAALLPLYSGAITKERAQQLVDLMNNPEHFNLKYPVPSVPASSDYFDPSKYWQGPTWVNMNWLIIDGLKRYGYEEEADQLKQKTLQMVNSSNMFEYFNPINANPEGAEGFSWTAALTIDLLNS